MHSEKIVNWEKYEVTGEHELTFTVTTGNPKCYGLRSVVKESNKSLQVAIVEGVLPNAPEVCAAMGMIEELTITTESPAQSLSVEAMAPEDVELTP